MTGPGNGLEVRQRRAERIVIGAFLRAMGEFGILPHENGQCPAGCQCEELADQIEERAIQIAAAALGVPVEALS